MIRNESLEQHNDCRRIFDIYWEEYEKGEKNTISEEDLNLALYSINQPFSGENDIFYILTCLSLLYSAHSSKEWGQWLNSTYAPEMAAKLFYAYVTSPELFPGVEMSYETDKIPKLLVNCKGIVFDYTRLNRSFTKEMYGFLHSKRNVPVLFDGKRVHYITTRLFRFAKNFSEISHVSTTELNIWIKENRHLLFRSKPKPKKEKTPRTDEEKAKLLAQRDAWVHREELVIEDTVVFGSNFMSPGFSLGFSTVDGRWNNRIQYYLWMKAQNFKDFETASILCKYSQKESHGLSLSSEYSMIHTENGDKTEWEHIKKGIMHKAVLQSFIACPHLQEVLLSDRYDGKKFIFADNDPFWGSGASFRRYYKHGTIIVYGQNIIGQIIGWVREELLEDKSKHNSE